MLVYGIHPVLEKLRAAPGDVIEVLMLPGGRGPALRRVEQTARQERCRVSDIDARALDALTQGAKHQGVAARIAPFAYGSFEALLAAPSPAAADCVLFLDGVVDPRNLGGILRSCEAMGVGRIVIPKDRAAGVTGAVIKTSAGAVRRTTWISTVFRTLLVDSWRFGIGATGWSGLTLRGRTGLVTWPIRKSWPWSWAGKSGVSGR